MIRSKKSFTLIELLVASAILGILVTICFVSFKTGSDSWIKSEARIQRYQNARGALEQMVREVASALVNNSSGTDRLDFCGFDESAQSGWEADSTADEVFFIPAIDFSADENPPDMDLCKAGYWLRGSDNTLMRNFNTADKSETPPLRYNFDENSSNQLSLHVTDLQFEYKKSGGNWQPTWDSRRNGFNGATGDGSERGTLPEAIRITITVQDEKAFEGTQDFSTVVVLPTAQ